MKSPPGREWFFLSVSQIDFPVSRIDSNRLDLTTFPTLLVRLFVWFFLSVLQIAFPVSRIDYTKDDSSQIDSNRVNSTTFPTLPVRHLKWFFLSVLQIDFPVSRIDYTMDDSSRIESIRPLFLPSLFAVLSDLFQVFCKSPFQLVESTTQRTIRVESSPFDHFSYPPCSPCCVIFF